LLLLEKVDFQPEVKNLKTVADYVKMAERKSYLRMGRNRKCFIDLYTKVLLANGKAVSKNSDEENVRFIEKFGNITEEDKEAGFIYILKSKSDKKEIKEIQQLFKIGYSILKLYKLLW